MRPALVSVIVALALMAVSIVGFALAERSNDQQEQALLKSDTNQAAIAATEFFASILSPLGSNAAVLRYSSDPVAAFKEIAVSPPFKMLLVSTSPSPHVVVASPSSASPPGQGLSGAALTTVEQATSTAQVKSGMVTAGPVNFNGKSATARFAVGPPNAPAGRVLYEQVSINPYTLITSSNDKPFEPLKLIIYGSPRPDVRRLAISTSNSVRLSGQTAQAAVAVGASDWTLVAAARRPFIGGFAKVFPVILLVLGLLLAVIIGLTIEILHRRHRYASDLVEDRTADLNRSLMNLEEAQDALVRGERLTAVGEMAMVVGHELRNPLAAVTNALYLIRRELPQSVSDMLMRNLSMAERETQKASTLADDLTAFVRPREMELSSIDIADLVQEVLSAAPPPATVELMSDVDAYTLVGDRGQMAEILTNVITNAYQAMPDGGTIRVSARMGDDGARLIVEDTGPGFDEAVRDRVFEPFFTTKYSGTGLGLAIVHRLVSAHGGTIDLENVPTGGARVTVVLPVLVHAVLS